MSSQRNTQAQGEAAPARSPVTHADHRERLDRPFPLGSPWRRLENGKLTAIKPAPARVADVDKN